MLCAPAFCADQHAFRLASATVNTRRLGNFMAATTPSGPNQILIIRHAEKPYQPSPGVDIQGVNYGASAFDKESLIPFGWQRAGALAQFFTTMNPGLTPNTVIASYPGAGDGGKGDSKSWRPMQTVIALLAKINNAAENSFYEPQAPFNPIPITLTTCPFNTQYDSGSWSEMATSLATMRGNVLVAWQHQDIINICKQIGAVLKIANPGDIPSDWPGNRFDIVFRFLLQPGAGTYQFSQIPQGLLAGDCLDLL